MEEIDTYFCMVGTFYKPVKIVPSVQSLREGTIFILSFLHIGLNQPTQGPLFYFLHKAIVSSLCLLDETIKVWLVIPYNSVQYIQEHNIGRYLN